MSVYMTEEEQLEAIKKWWRQYSTMITVALSVVLLCIAGYRYWNWHQEKLTYQASNTYERMMLAFSHKNNSSVQANANQLIKNYNHTIYADVAHLLKAKLYVEQNKMPLAQSELNTVIQSTQMPALKQVARLRLARILSAQKSYDKALVELKTVDDDAYLTLINELKGDIYAEKGNYQQAVVYYRSAIDQGRAKGAGNLFLEMKNNEIASMSENINRFNQKAPSA